MLFWEDFFLQIWEDFWFVKRSDQNNHDWIPLGSRNALDLCATQQSVYSQGFQAMLMGSQV